MYKCHICLTSLVDVKTLVIHYKQKHYFKATNDYECFNCSQIYNLKSFKRHFERSCKNLNPSPSSSTPVLVDDTFSFEENIQDTNLENKSTPPEQHNIFEVIETSATRFLCNLYGNSNLSRKIVEDIVADLTEEFFSVIFKKLNQEFSEHIKTDMKDKFKHTLTFLQNPFHKVKTFYKFIQTTKSNNLYHEPSSYIINKEVCVKSGTIPSLDSVESDGIILPLNFQFKKFFELPEIYKATIQNMKYLITNNINHLVTTNIWRERISKFPEEKRSKVIPFNLYFDDFESNNPLGSHGGTHSIGAVYYNFPSLPQHINSELNNIFVAMLFYSKYKCFGENSIFYHLVEEIKILEEKGVPITLRSGETDHFYFVLGLITGDNLGLNTILGYSKSFNSHYYCRICTCSKTQNHVTCSDKSSYHRTFIGYKNDIVKFSKSSERMINTGIREESVFNNIPSFHVVHNVTVDIMHDIFEGVCHYDLCKLFNQFILVDNFFSLDVLNNRTQLFKYSKSEIGNIAPIIKPEHIQRQKLNMSAKEMWTFCRFLPIIIGDLVPEKNNHWKLLTFLNKIIDIVLKSDFKEVDIHNLQTLISRHHSRYIKLFNEKLKPKFHFMIHYPYVMRMLGPLKHFWSFRFESKHKELKNYCNSITSRKNLPLSLGIKSSLMFSKRVTCISEISPEISNISKTNEFLIKESFFYSKLRNISSYKIHFDDELSYNSLTYQKICYKINDYIGFSENIFRIECLVLLKTIPYVICEKIIVSDYIDHFNSYEVLKNTDDYYIYIINKFDGPPVSLLSNPNGKNYIFLNFF
ncbi:uncharacterized protein LOC129942965 isoform X1 [Eupeodes corollae]|uniref:uncharacterized protein LOC129942965 isoform X1 n=1 Tax=Eupeodes corollae TaxID=290404 RepID=UPI002492649A|nr:uncharacterized protein LOC129942965 isoform X1 [Eupeodes corollae]